MALNASFSMNVGMLAITYHSPINCSISTWGTVWIGGMDWHPERIISKTPAIIDSFDCIMTSLVDHVFQSERFRQISFVWYPAALYP
jgi:hypothetical protein